MTNMLLSFNKNQEESSGSNAESESANRGTFRVEDPMEKEGLVEEGLVCSLVNDLLVTK